MASVMNLVMRRPQVAQYRISPFSPGVNSWNIKWATTPSGTFTTFLSVPNSNVANKDPYKDWRSGSGFTVAKTWQMPYTTGVGPNAKVLSAGQSGAVPVYFNPNTIQAGLDTGLFYIQAYPVTNGTEGTPLNMKAVGPYSANPGMLENPTGTAPLAASTSGSLYVPFSESVTGFSITNTGTSTLYVAFNGSTEEMSVAA